MKKILLLCLAFGIGSVLMLASCKKTGPKATLTSGTAGKVTASSSTIVLDHARVNTSDTSVTFTIAASNFGFSAATTNVLQFDSVGDNWAHPKSVSMSAGAAVQTFSTYDFNTLVLSLNVPADSTKQIQVRLVSTVSTETVMSDAITITVTPFSSASYLYVPSAGGGWSLGAADSIVSPTSNGIYSGVINITGTDSFKITASNQNWNVAYGGGSAAGVVSLSPSASNLYAPGLGAWLITLNTNTMTVTYTAQWSVLGDATAGGWDVDNIMYINKANNTYYATVRLTSDGTKQIKFRYTQNWNTTLGIGTANGLTGTLTSPGNNITIPATPSGGTSYLITMDPTGLTYSLAVQAP